MGTQQHYQEDTINLCTNYYRLGFTVVINNLKFSMSTVSWKGAPDISSHFRTQDDRPSLSETLEL